jgi:hypothetical protein
VPCAEISSSILAQAAIAPAGSRCSARSQARTNDLDAAKQWRTIGHQRKATRHHQGLAPLRGAPMSLFRAK